MSPSQIFLFFLDEALYLQMVDPRKIKEFPYSSYIVTVAMKLLIMSKGPPPKGKRGSKLFRSQYILLKRQLQESADILPRSHAMVIPGFHTFQKFHRMVLLTHQAGGGHLSQKMFGVLAPRGKVSLHPVVRKFHGDIDVDRGTETVRMTEGKHQISEISMLLDGRYPIFLGGLVAPLIAREVDSSQLLRMWEWVGQLQACTNSRPIVYCDRFYVDPLVADYCTLHNIRIVARVKPSRFNSYIEFLALQDDETLGAMYCKESASTFLYFEDSSSQYTSQAIFSNAVILRRREESDTHFWLLKDFKRVQGVAVEANQKLSQFWWPFQRMGWLPFLDSYYMTCIISNVYHIWLYHHEEEPGMLPFGEFCKILGHQLLLWKVGRTPG